MCRIIQVSMKARTNVGEGVGVPSCLPRPQGIESNLVRESDVGLQKYIGKTKRMGN